MEPTFLFISIIICFISGGDDCLGLEEKPTIPESFFTEPIVIAENDTHITEKYELEVYSSLSTNWANLTASQTVDTISWTGYQCSGDYEECEETYDELMEIFQPFQTAEDCGKYEEFKTKSRYVHNSSLTKFSYPACVSLPVEEIRHLKEMEKLNQIIEMIEDYRDGEVSQKQVADSLKPLMRVPITDSLNTTMLYEGDDSFGD